MLTHTIELHPARDRAEVVARIETALADVNRALGLTFVHDGEHVEPDIKYAVWTDDVEGSTETSWVRLVDFKIVDGLYVDINAIDERQLAALRDALGARLRA